MQLLPLGPTRETSPCYSRVDQITHINSRGWTVLYSANHLVAHPEFRGANISVDKFFFLAATESQVSSRLGVDSPADCTSETRHIAALKKTRNQTSPTSLRSRQLCTREKNELKQGLSFRGFQVGNLGICLSFHFPNVRCHDLT